MRRLLLIGVPLCLAIGAAIGFALANNDNGPDLAASANTTTTVTVLGERVTRPTTNTPARSILPFLGGGTTTTTAAPAPTTTTTARRATTTTTRGATAAGATTTTTRRAATDCGSGSWSAATAFRFDSTTNGYAIDTTVSDNAATKAIEIDALAITVKYQDGTSEDITIGEAAGKRVEPGAPAKFSVSRTKAPAEIAPKTFDFHVAGQPACKSQAA